MILQGISFYQYSKGVNYYVTTPYSHSSMYPDFQSGILVIKV